MGSLTFVASSGTLVLDPWWGLTLGLLLVLLNGFFVAAEFALVKVRPTQIEPLAQQGSRRALLLKHMTHHLDAYLSATQLGITLASLALGWIGEPAFAWLIEPVVMKLPGASEALLRSLSISLAFLVITILHIVVGELAPKSLAIRKAEVTSLAIAIPLAAFYRITYPAIWVLNHAANALLKPFGIEPVSESELSHSEEELRLLLAQAETTEVSAQKRALLDNIFELSNRFARQVMVPRADVVYLSTDKSVEENLALARESEHTRLPLCDGDLDHVVGLIHIKDLFRRHEPVQDLRAMARRVSFVPGTLPLDRLLRRMRVEQIHLAAVLDEYGGVDGIVTLENVIEEIVGQIQDEFDEETPEIVRVDGTTWEIDGGVLVAELEREVGVEMSDRDEDTIAGVVLSELGRSPQDGDQVILGPAVFTVLETEGNRVTSIRVKLEPEDSAAAEPTS